jgi:hypothetical protein
MKPGSQEWKDSINKGRELRRQELAANWEFADVLAQLPESKLGEFYDDVGEGAPDPATMQIWRAAAMAWPSEKRVADCSLNAHAVLAGNPDRFDLLRAGMGVEDAMMSGWKAA